MYFVDEPIHLWLKESYVLATVANQVNITPSSPPLTLKNRHHTVVCFASIFATTTKKTLLPRIPGSTDLPEVQPRYDAHPESQGQ